MMGKNREICREEKLVEYLDGTLEFGEEKKLERHLRGCAVCRERLESLSATLDLANRASIPEQNPLYVSSFVYQVRQGIEAQNSTSSWWSWRAGLVGALVLAIGIAWYSLTPFPLSNPEVGGKGPEPRVAMVESGQEMAAILDAYWLDTATTDELLSEVVAIDRDELLALLEDY